MSTTPTSTSASSATIAADSNPSVFISYSPKDLAVKRLSADLNAAGTFCDFDVTDSDPNNVVAGISAEDEWWKRLQEMITRAHVVVFVVSLHSSQSRVCDEEVAFPLANAKRVVAVTYGSVDLSALPPRLSALNIVIHFGDGLEPGYTQASNQLATVIRLDVHWHRKAADAGVAARKWDAHGRGDEALARGAELRALNTWAARRPTSAPPHSELVLAYLNACQESEADSVATFDAERARYLELMEVAKPILEQEILAREAESPADHLGVRREQEVELERLKSLLGDRWHPLTAKHVTSTSARDGYAEVFRFPCCDKTVLDFSSLGEGDPPNQFRADGCEQIPVRLQHGLWNRSNPFRPLLPLCGSK
jgi:hypothetical protein